MRSKIFLFLLPIFLLSACVSSEDTSPDETVADPAAQAPVAQEYHPLSTRTMVEEIDIVINAVESGNVSKLFVFLQTTCVTVNGLGGPPPCREDEAEGTPVEVLPFLGAEGSFFRKDEIQDSVGLKAIGVYAVYEISDTVFSDANYPAGDYGIMTVGLEGRPDVVLQVTGDGIVRIAYIFFNAYGSTLIDFLQSNAKTMILAPVSP